jgi:hypothetical protein
MPLTKADNPRALGRREQMAETKKEAATAAASAPPTPEHMRKLAEDLPEKDEVQKATKAAMLAETPAEEVKHKLKVVEASPNAEDTPSGYALKAVASIADDEERGEKYTAHKSARRWGYAPV